MINSAEVTLTILIPCFNEEKNIEATLNTVLGALVEVKCSYEVLVVDDQSTDRTLEVAQHWIASHPEVNARATRNSKNRGLSRTYVDGAFEGHGRYYRLVCGDNAEPRSSLVKIFKRIGDADMIVPYHPLVPGKSWGRLQLSRAYTWLVNTISGYHLKYYNGLAVHLRYNVMRWGPYSFGFGFQAELITRLLDEGATYIEVPVDVFHQEKDARASALNWRNFLSVTHTLLDILIRRIRRHAFEH
jgi:glycosyltransferase involved in cell wall biosynthesis